VADGILAAMEVLPVGVLLVQCVQGGEPVLLGHNAACRRIAGVAGAPGTRVADLPWSLHLPDRITRVAPEDGPFSTAARTGEAVPEQELHLRRRDGDWRVLLVSATPIPGTPGSESRRAMGILHDVTERRRAEDGLSRRGQLFRLVVETSPDPVFVKNREAQYLFANPATLAALGRRAGEVLGRRYAELPGAGEEASGVEASDRRVLDGGKEEVVEETVPTPLGPRVFLITKSPWRDSSGLVIGLIGMGRDITERKHAEEALRASERRFRALIERSSDVLLLLDGQGRIGLWSAAAEATLGWTAGERTGKPALDLVHPDDAAAVGDAFLRMKAAAGAVVRHRARLRHRDGTWRLVEGVGRDLRGDPSIGALVLNVRDVTEQARTEELLLQGRKLDSLGLLAGGVAHDFNNLLTIILCSVEAERMALDAGEPVAREEVDQIRNAGERARDLTRRLLAFARRQVIEPATLDLGEMVAGSERLLRRMLREDVRLEARRAPGLWPVRCDPVQLEQVLFNLAVNARDAMPAGGTLSIATENVAAGLGEPGVPDGDWVRLRVADSGTGMSQEVQEHLFEPFFTTKQAGVGTGLGLATVYGTVRQAGGHVRVRSNPGQGTTVDVLLPRAEPEAAPERIEAASRTSGGTETVLLVEDDPDVREAAARALRAGGYQVLTAEGPERATEVLRACASPPDVLVTDVIMTGSTGRALADRLREDRPGLPVLFLSGHAHDLIAPCGVLDPGSAFLAKPFTPSALLGKVREVLDAVPA
jgi:two-component system, cell cycle sensor histidine kinase and response regulator CckA